MQAVVCAMAKNEHLYIKDWVEHYLKIGFDKIYIYDNDDIGAKDIRDFIPKSNKVVVYDIRGQARERLQYDVYTEFYNAHKFDWCLFVDIDEFLSGVKDIHAFLEQPQFRLAKQIRIKWRLFGDDNKIERDMSKPVYRCFLNVLTSSLDKSLTRPDTLQEQGKAMVRGGLPNVVVHSPHFASFKRRDNVIPSILPSGRPCWSKIEIKENYRFEGVFINHYITKSLSEFVKQKLNRNDAVFNKSIKLNYYWRVNKKTKEKIEYLKNLGLE